jgi:hypothetical protein
LRLTAEGLSAHALLTRLEEAHPRFACELSSPSAARRHLLAKFDDTLDWPEHRHRLLSWLDDHAEALAYCARSGIEARFDSAVYAAELPQFYGFFAWPLADLRRLVKHGVDIEFSVYRSTDEGEVAWSAVDRSLRA